MAFKLLSSVEVDLKEAHLYTSRFALTRLGAAKKILVNEAKEKKTIVEIGFYDLDDVFHSLTSLTKEWNAQDKKFTERSGSASDELRAATSKAALKAFEGRSVQLNPAHGFDWAD